MQENMCMSNVLTYLYTYRRWLSLLANLNKLGELKFKTRFVIDRTYELMFTPNVLKLNKYLLIPLKYVKMAL